MVEHGNGSVGLAVAQLVISKLSTREANIEK